MSLVSTANLLFAVYLKYYVGIEFYMSFTKGHKPVRKWLALEAIKHLELSMKGTGKI
jgi:hypothetical protein|tara:strand:- start:13059 stop:13229 length:171 start_codon:yes stop_codon:yes gene_type:complete